MLGQQRLQLLGDVGFDWAQIGAVLKRWNANKEKALLPHQ
jgi:hypothetical protein